jgi:hypothetical protein
MAQVIFGNHSSVIVPRQDRDRICSFCCDALGGKITKAEDRISNQVGKYPVTFEEGATISAAVDPAGRKKLSVGTRFKRCIGRR